MTAPAADCGALDLRATDGRLLWAAVGGSPVSRAIAALKHCHQLWPGACIIFTADGLDIYESLDGPLIAAARTDQPGRGIAGDRR